MKDRTPLRRLAAPAGVVVTGLVLLFLFEPAEGGIFPPCPFHAITGLHCPGCGTLRALNRLLHADVAGAVGMNALSMLFLPFVLYHLASRVRIALGRRPLPGAAFVASLGWWAIGLLVLFGVLRNLPFEPFSHLAPG